MGKSPSGSCDKMYKIDSGFHIPNKRNSLLHSLYDKIAVWTKSFYLPDIFAMVSSVITDIMPRIGKYVTNSIVALATNILVAKLLQKKDFKIVEKVENPKKILIISDLNIGDAINLQSVVLAAKRAFPQSKIDYAVNAKAYNLVFNNPYIDGVFNILSYDIYKSRRAVISLLHLKEYDYVVNLCPFFKKDSIVDDKQLPLIDYKALSASIIYNELWDNNLNHISYQAYSYFSSLFSKSKKSSGSETENGAFIPSIWLSDKAIHKAKHFLQENALINNKGIVLFNPDATSVYSQIPFDIQLDILKKLCESDSVQAILLTSGHTYTGIENKLIKSLPSCSKITVVPKDMPIDDYASLIDFCDVFVTADTGTMHIAAAKKFNESGSELRNKTAVFSVFGASSARMYGYDSYNGKFLKPGQDRPSKLYIPKASCRNITCVNKKAKRCKKIRCFEGINGLEIAKDIMNYFSKDK